MILTSEPANFTEYTQLMGRSDRTDPGSTKYGTLLSPRDAVDQQSLEQALKYKDDQMFLVSRGCRDNLKDLNEAIASGNLEKPEIAIALRDHNNGKTRHEWKQKIEQLRKQR